MEALDEVERAFVHVDYEQRDEPEHKIERNLQHGARNLFSAHDSVRNQVLSLAFIGQIGALMITKYSAASGFCSPPSASTLLPLIPAHEHSLPCGQRAALQLQRLKGAIV